MRTPGDDKDLAAGFLFTEGMIVSTEDVKSIDAEGRNAVTVILNRGAHFDPALWSRHSFISSSCGACGKRSIAAVRVAQRHNVRRGRPVLTSHVIHALPDTLRRAQAEFSLTGGIHASALFNSNGKLVRLREDVGRHNALDKLIGAELMAGNVPLAAEFCWSVAVSALNWYRKQRSRAFLSSRPWALHRAWPSSWLRNPASPCSDLSAIIASISIMIANESPAP